jgi:hypothetical protein
MRLEFRSFFKVVLSNNEYSVYFDKLKPKDNSVTIERTTDVAISSPVVTVKLPKLPWVMAQFVAIICLLAAGGTGYANFRHARNLTNHASIMAKASRAVSDIRYYDEVLTMSAFMAVTSGNLKWQKRYDAEAPKVDIANAMALKIAPVNAIVNFKDSLTQATEKLISMETRAFNFVKVGNLDAAREIMESSEYAEQKRIYTKSNIAFRDSILAEVARLEKSDENQANSLTIMNAALGALVVALSSLFYVRLKRWHKVASDIVDNYSQTSVATQVRDQELIAQQSALAIARQYEIEASETLRHKDQELLKQQDAIAATRQQEVNRAHTIYKKCEAFEKLIEQTLSIIGKNSHSMMENAALCAQRASAQKIMLKMPIEIWIAR